MVRDMQLDCSSDTKQACYTRGEANWARKTIITFHCAAFFLHIGTPELEWRSTSCHHFESQSSGWLLQPFPRVCVGTAGLTGVTRTLKWRLFLLLWFLHLICCLLLQTMERKAARHWTTALEPAIPAASQTSVTPEPTPALQHYHQGDFP